MRILLTLISLVALLLNFLSIPDAVGFDLDTFQKTVEQIQKTIGQAQNPAATVPSRPVSGVITIDDVSRPWYFKMDWFDAAACSRIYYQVNNGKPIFLVEFAGPHPPTGAPIKIEGLNPGDRIKFLVKTHWHGWRGPVDSTNNRYFKAFQKGPRLYYFQFEDAGGADMAYNDGAFYFYQEGYGPQPNRLIWIKNFEASKVPGGILFKGTVHVSRPGPVISQIDIRDNTWNTYRLIDLSFNAQRPGDYPFDYTLRDPLPAPMYTSFWQVSFYDERDARVRALKGCIEEIGQGGGMQLSGDLVLYYDFDNCRAQDQSGNGLDGVIYGSPMCIDGLQVRSLYFNSVDHDNGCGRPGGDYISLPAFGSIWEKGITICAWVKFEEPRSYEKIVDLGRSNGENGGYNVVFGRIGTTNSIEIESWVNTDGSYNRTVGRLSYPGIVNGEWRHYCATIDNKTRKMKLYINGSLKAEKTGNGVANVARSRNFIAHSNWCFNDPDFKGAIDELRIYKRALTADEIRRLYSKSAAMPPKPAQGSAFGSTRKNPFIFQGFIYYLPNGTSRLPDFSRLTPVGRIYNAILDIKPQRFDKGFPGITDRFEWFAIDYKGKIFISKPGTYTFSLLSDDGSRLLIDNKVVIDNDGIHPPIEKTGQIFLGKGLHSIEVQYFQGPRYYVALVLSLVKNGRKIPFDIRQYAPVSMKEERCQTRLSMGSGILFDFNSYSLKPQAIEVLDSVLELLKDMPYEKIIVEGHTDNIGSDAYNDRLSRQRAQAVASYLVARGIPSSAIKVIGYGKRRPLVPNDTEEHRARNRRVEIVVKRPCGK